MILESRQKHRSVGRDLASCNPMIMLALTAATKARYPASWLRLGCSYGLGQWSSEHEEIISNPDSFWVTLSSELNCSIPTRMTRKPSQLSKVLREQVATEQRDVISETHNRSFGQHILCAKSKKCYSQNDPDSASPTNACNIGWVTSQLNQSMVNPQFTNVSLHDGYYSEPDIQMFLNLRRSR